MSRPRSVIQAEPAEKPRAFEGTGTRAYAGEGHVAGAVLEPVRGNASDRLGRRLADRPAAAVFGLAVLAGYVLLAALAIAVGFVLVELLVPIHAIGHSDEAVNDWLAANRTPSLDDASYVGSSLGDTPFIPALVILVVVGAAILRRWRVFGFVAGAILVEVATYRVTSLIVHRDRPSVPRMDNLPVDQSYPSGHVAASVVVYIGLALLISSRLERGRLKTLLWAVAILVPLVVVASRLYRGMHHPIDAGAGILVGLGAIAVVLFATRAAVAAASSRSEKSPA